MSLPGFRLLVETVDCTLQAVCEICWGENGELEDIHSSICRPCIERAPEETPTVIQYTPDPIPVLKHLHK